jgi:hypothetical protein
MAIKQQFLSAVERSNARGKDSLERYVGGAGKVIETAGKVLARLPGGQRVSSAYVERSTRLVNKQRDVAVRLLDAQAKLPSRLLRRGAAADPAA